MKDIESRIKTLEDKVGTGAIEASLTLDDIVKGHSKSINLGDLILYARKRRDKGHEYRKEN
jgi:hypothetical protein